MKLFDYPFIRKLLNGLVEKFIKKKQSFPRDNQIASGGRMKAVEGSAAPKNRAVSGLNLDLAWRRVKRDRPDRCFVSHPCHFNWIEADLAGWLQLIEDELAIGYEPQSCLPCNIPKAGWMVRPGSILDIKDEIVYNAIIGRFYEKIWNLIGNSQGRIDIAYQLRGDPANSEWIRPYFPAWKQFQGKSLAKLQQGATYVLFTDITGFYENIDLPRLHSDLNALSVDRNSLQVLTACLNRWSYPRNKGIPQGYSGSDILAKLYMHPVDRALGHAGFSHLRYVDDIRIFCTSKLEAQRALLKLSVLLRWRGLNLQSAKTKIVSCEDARKKIDGITPVLRTIESQLRDELRELYEEVGPYATVGEIDRILAGHPDAPALEVVESAFERYFGATSHEDFDKTLFHYLLNRLAKAKSRVAIGFCMAMLSQRPEETSYALKYFKEVDLNPYEIAGLTSYVASDEAIYDYQLYEIMRWFYYREEIPELLICLCRQWALNKNRDAWLRSYCLAILGRTGDAADLETIETKYAEATSGIEKSDMIAALSRMENGRRNSFYGRVQSDGELVRRAIAYARSAEVGGR